MRDMLRAGHFPEDGEPSSDHRAPGRSPLTLGVPEDDRFEAMMRRLVDQIQASERRYADALSELQSKLGQVTAQVAGADVSEAEKEALDRVQEEVAGLTGRIEQAGDAEMPDPFEVLEQRMSSMTDGPPADVFAASGLPNAEQTIHHFADLFASEPKPFPGISTEELDQRFQEMTQRFEAALKEQNPAERIEAIGARLDGVSERLDKALARPAEADALAGIEKQIAELGTTFAEAESQFARLGMVETQLSSVLDRVAEGTARIEQFTAKTAIDTARLVASAQAATDQRLNSLQTRIMAMGQDSRTGDDRLFDVLDEVKAILKGLAPAAAHDLDWRRPEPTPVEDYLEPILPSVEESLAPFMAAAFAREAPVAETPRLDREQMNSLWPETVETALPADTARNRLGAAIPDFIEQPANDRDADTGGARGGGDADFIAAARRAAQNAAAKAKTSGSDRSRGTRNIRSVAQSFRRPPIRLPSAKRLLNWPRPVLYAAAVAFLLASGLILYGLMRASAGPESTPTSEQSLPEPRTKATDRASEQSPEIITGQSFAPAKSPDDTRPADDLAATGAPAETEAPITASLEQGATESITVVTKRRHGETPASPAEEAGEPDAAAEPDVAPAQTATTGSPAPAFAPMTQEVARTTTEPRTVKVMPPEAPAAVAEKPGDAAASNDANNAAPREMPPVMIGPWSLRLAAANGDPAAALEVGIRYAQGSGVDRDYAAAARWYAKAAAKAVPAAQYRLAVLYERGQGVAKDVERARIWYGRAAELGNVKAMHNLAVMQTGQEGVAPDYTTAAEWFGKAGQRGLADSQYNLGILYENGLGVRKNMGEAYKWFALAASGGDAEALKRRDLVRPQLSANMRSEMDAAIRAWHPEQLDKAANNTNSSFNGWRDAAASAENPQPASQSFAPTASEEQ